LSFAGFAGFAVSAAAGGVVFVTVSSADAANDTVRRDVTRTRDKIFIMPRVGCKQRTRLTSSYLCFFT
jgi:hypothetical protein